MGYLLAIDQGTTGSTALLIDDSSFDYIDKCNEEFPQIYPTPGQVEHNTDDIWKSVSSSIKAVLERNKISGSDISAIGITNQRETICSFNKKGEPLYNAIVWQDRRTGEFCENLKTHNKESMIKEKTGLPVDPYFSGTKIHWLLNNSTEVMEASKNSDLLFGNIDTFLLYKLTGGESYFTEASNASRTMLYNIKEGCWDPELCELLGVSPSTLPEVKDSFTHFGNTKGLEFLPDGIPITGILGDQQSALFGQAGIKEGALKCTYGTGAFILLNTGAEPFYSDNGLITTVAFRKDGKNIYALEGSSYIAGAAVQWLRDNLKIIKTSPEVEELALQVKNLDEMKNILFLPFFTGIGSPYWKSNATATITGLTRDTGNPHLALACLDGICLSIQDLINAMKIDSNLAIGEIRVDGGAVSNDLLMEIQATISELNIIKPKVIETTAYGACLAAALGAGTITFEQIEKLWQQDKVFEPASKKIEHYSVKKAQWNETIKRLYL